MFADPARARHAFKVAIAMVLTFWLALQWQWINPYWAGFAVLFCSLTTQGESLNKMMMRIMGTIIAVMAALTMMALFGQDRWYFLAACCVYAGILAYIITGKRNNYMWQVSFFVVMAIIPYYSSDINYLFQVTVARLQETILGCSLWALIDMLIWPVTNLSSLTKTAADLSKTQQKLVCLCGEATLRADSRSHNEADFSQLRGQQVQLVSTLSSTLQAAGSESYDVSSRRPAWDQLVDASREFATEIDQWQAGLAELSHIELATLVPNSAQYIAAIQQDLAQPDTEERIQYPKLVPDRSKLEMLKYFDQAAVLVCLQHLEKISMLAGRLRNARRKIADLTVTEEPQAKPAAASSGGFFIPDPDRLRAMTFIIALICGGFLIWIYVDPPGHQKTWTMPAIFGTFAILLPFMRIAGAMLKVFLFAVPLAGLIHIFILPTLSGYSELGLLMFVFMFAVHYWMKNPLVGTLSGVGFLTINSLENTQTFSFVAVAVGYYFLLTSLMLVIVFSYLLGSPRPEKKFMSLVRRYFRSAEFALEAMGDRSRAPQSFIFRWRIAFHQQELATLPAKMQQWGSQIDHKAFPDNDAEKVAELIARMDGLHYRLQALLSLRDQSQATLITKGIAQQLSDWRLAMQACFSHVSSGSGTATAEEISQRLDQRLDQLEESLAEVMESDTSRQLADQDRMNAYLLLGAYRGVANKALDWLAEAENINWEQWREECFS